MTPEQVARVLGLLSAAYPRWQLTEATLAVYADGLVGIEAVDAEAAVQDWVMSHAHPPAIAELRSAAVDCRSRRVQPLPERSLPAGRSPTTHTYRQLANLRAWAEGQISTEAMMRDSAGIYAQAGAWDADEVADAMEQAIDDMARRRERAPRVDSPLALGGRMRRVASGVGGGR